MSVASMAGYLAKNGGGGQSTYYKTYSIPSNTEITTLNTQTEILGDGVIIPPVGTYLVNTFIAFKSYNGDGDAAGNINNAEILVQYGNTLVNNQTYYSNVPNNENIYFLQTSGVFTSDSTGSIIITVNAITATDAESYNILTGDYQIPQVQIISLSGYTGGGSGSTFETVTIGETGTQVNLSCPKNDVLDVNNILTYTLELVNENNTDNTVFLYCDNDDNLNVTNITITGNGITFPDDSVQTTAYTGGGGGNVFETVTIGASGTQVQLSCDEAEVLLINGENAATQSYVNTNFQPIGIASVRGTIPIADNASGWFASEKVGITNFTGDNNSTYFITMNIASELFPLSGSCVFDSNDGNGVIVNCSFFYNSTTPYSGGFATIPFSVLAMK
jgi:hypothetical protein